jgi:anti-anti-sigma regulatory factor
MDEPRVLMTAAHELSGEAGRVTLDGRLVASTAVLLHQAVRRLLADGATSIEVDATDVSATDAAGHDALAAAADEAREKGASLHVTPLPRPATPPG